MEEKEQLLPPTEERGPRGANDCSCEDWSDNSSCSSYYSDSESSEAEWESSIDSTGELLFIDCDPVVSHLNPDDSPPAESFSKAAETRRSTRSKFLKLLRRKDSKRRSRRPAKSHDSQDTAKVKFHDHQEGEVREVVLKVDPCARKMGRRADYIECVLGLTVSTLSDGHRVMVAGFVPEKEAARQKAIKIGDWLKSINDVDVFYQNLNGVLERFVHETEITLRLQRVVGIEVTKNPPRSALSNQSSFVRQLTSKMEMDDVVVEELRAHCMGVVCVTTEGLREDGGEFDGVLHCFPPPEINNLLCMSRGAFITLNHLLQDFLQDQPMATSAFYNDRLLHIAYQSCGSKLLLFMLPDDVLQLNEIIMFSRQIVRLLRFLYGSIEQCMESEGAKRELDALLLRVFAKLAKSSRKTRLKFEESLAAVDFVSLPDEVQMQIDDALSELEACDYREWNDDPLDCQRLFTVLGSAFFHSGHLLASHFPHDDLIDIVLYCRHNGIFYLSQSEPVRSLVLWKPVFPSSCQRGDQFTDGRRFLLIVGSGKDLLVALMEVGGCTEPPADNMGPDPFYVEEVQATLAHLQDIGIPALADRWIESHDRRVVVPQVQTKRRVDFLGNMIANKSSPAKEPATLPVQRKQEVTSILKRRCSDQMLAGAVLLGGGEDAEVCSEDSASQGERSEMSDEPVVGRRATREKRYDSGDEDSDVEDYRDGSQSSSSYDLSELRQSLGVEPREGPDHFTTGTENVLFHYVHFDASEGILLCPFATQNDSRALNVILDSFKQAAHHIHHLFQNTLGFKEISSQNVSKCMMNKNLVAIKEYGTLFECNLLNENSRKFGKITYWVVGRLFDMPHPREMYVCYQDTIPQNVIEIAFKLGVSLVM